MLNLDEGHIAGTMGLPRVMEWLRVLKKDDKGSAKLGYGKQFLKYKLIKSPRRLRNMMQMFKNVSVNTIQVLTSDLAKGRCPVEEQITQGYIEEATSACGSPIGLGSPIIGLGREALPNHAQNACEDAAEDLGRNPGGDRVVVLPEEFSEEGDYVVACRPH